jgi:hypothetical protein
MSIPEVVAVNEPLTIQSATKKSKRGLLILVFLLVAILFAAIGAVGYWLLTSSNDNEESDSDSQNEETQDTTSTDRDTTNDETTDTTTDNTTDANLTQKTFTGMGQTQISISYPSTWTFKETSGDDGGGITITSPNNSIFLYSYGLGDKVYQQECAQTTTEVQGTYQTFKRFKNENDTWSQQYDVWEVCEKYGSNVYSVDASNSFSYRVKTASDLAVLDSILKTVKR